MKVKVHNPSELPIIDYRTLEPFQGGLKQLPADREQKLLNSLKKHGFFVPLYVWYFGEKRYLLDGHQRQIVMTANDITDENGGYGFPHVRIDANGINDAKEKLLAITSQYGQITQQGYNEFVSDLDLSAISDTVVFDTEIDLSGETGAPGEAGETGINYHPQHGVIVICEGEDHQQEVFDKLTSQGYNCKIVVT